MTSEEEHEEVSVSLQVVGSEQSRLIIVPLEFDSFVGKVSGFSFIVSCTFFKKISIADDSLSLVHPPSYSKLLPIPIVGMLVRVPRKQAIPACRG